MAKLYNRARVTTATSGTGTVTLGSAVSNAYCTFAEAGVQNNDAVSYLIEDGTNFEIGAGTYTSSGPMLSRDTVRLSKIGGTAGTNKINLSGSATVTIMAAAEDLISKSEANPAFGTNLIVPGGLNIGFSSAPGADILGIGDANFLFAGINTFSANGPAIVFNDFGDENGHQSAMLFDRINNRFDFRVDNQIRLLVAKDFIVGGNGDNTMPLGVSGWGFSDLFLGSGAVINFGANDFTITHGSGALALSGNANFGGDISLPTTGSITWAAGGDGAVQLEIAGDFLTDHPFMRITSEHTVFEWNHDTVDAEPFLELRRLSATPAANDSIGMLAFSGQNSGATITDYAFVRGLILDPTSGAEYGRLILRVAVNGSEADVALFDQDTASGETAMWLYDHDNGQLERVTVGGANSGGTGFKVLRIPN